MQEASQFFRCIQVTLREDLSRYHPALKSGSMGVTVAPVGLEATASERFCRVRFGDVDVDVLWSGLEVTDVGWIAAVAALEAARVDAIAVTTKAAVRHLGQRGGFRRLVVPYALANGMACTWVVKGRAERKKCEAILARLNVPISEVIDR